jgi:predicted alpha/beta superfamily hydrolase
VILNAVLIMLGIVAATGKVVFEGNIHSEILQTNRFVRIYLPPGYEQEKTARYPVLYVHDGQNAFSTVGPHVAFGWGNWALDTTADRLIAEKKMRPIMMVAVDCGPSRYREYRGPISAGADNRAYERYAEFLIRELKPRIDREYRTLNDPVHTGVLGSSMGGICSVALAWEHPQVFGLAASLSGAFQVEKHHFLERILKSPIARKKEIRIYLDSGRCDFSGGDDGLKQTEAVRDGLVQLGWKEGEDLLHLVDQPLRAEQLAPLKLPPDKFNEAQRSQHNELYWRLRVWRPLTFLFPPEKKN